MFKWERHNFKENQAISKSKRKAKGYDTYLIAILVIVAGLATAGVILTIYHFKDVA